MAASKIIFRPNLKESKNKKLIYFPADRSLPYCASSILLPLTDKLFTQLTIRCFDKLSIPLRKLTIRLNNYKALAAFGSLQRRLIFLLLLIVKIWRFSLTTSYLPIVITRSDSCTPDLITSIKSLLNVAEEGAING